MAVVVEKSLAHVFECSRIIALLGGFVKHGEIFYLLRRFLKVRRTRRTFLSKNYRFFILLIKMKIEC